MKIEILAPDRKLTETDLLLYPVFDKDSSPQDQSFSTDDPLPSLLSELLRTGEWKPAQGSSNIILTPQGTAPRRVGLIGLGGRDEVFDGGKFRTAVMNILGAVRAAPIRKITAVLVSKDSQAELCRRLFEGIYMGLFDPAVYKTGEKNECAPDKIELLAELDSETINIIGGETAIICEGINLARKLANEPGNLLYPERLAQEIESAVAETDLELDILKEAEMRQKGFDCLLAVAQGSRNKPRLCVLEHNPAEDQEASPLVLVGKGVTFDSGGISIKPADSMEEMKADKSGACSVLGAMIAISRMKIPARVIGIMPLVENLPGGNAQRPGDVIKAYNGTTVEVINTDAEGRLIMADAMAWAVENYKPQCLVDIATLTGACVVALGHVRAGLFSNDDTLCEKFSKASDLAGEKMWRMPLDDDYKESLESTIADIKNCGERWGSAIIAAKFLESFIDKTPWCHIDMAGTDFFRSGPNKGTPPGFGVMSMVEFARLLSGKSVKI